ncbi:MAG: hypothetical protein KDK66_07125 [Deltaproteobacteria bacterium]|nr:hypothetical protein [Deltaproteobacteria bacterium]
MKKYLSLFLYTSLLFYSLSVQALDLYVTTTQDTDNPQSDHCDALGECPTLRDAIRYIQDPTKDLPEGESFFIFFKQAGVIQLNYGSVFALAADLQDPIIIDGNHEITLSGESSPLLVSAFGQKLTLLGLNFEGKNPSNYGGCLLLGKGDFLIQESLFENCQANQNGGAIWASLGSKLEINTSRFKNNYATGDGGAIYYDNKISYGLEIKNTSFENNQADKGGALSLINTQLEFPVPSRLVNTSFYNNQAQSKGGGIYVGPYQIANIEFSTLHKNKTPNLGSTGQNLYVDINGSAILENNILGEPGNPGEGQGQSCNVLIPILFESYYNLYHQQNNSASHCINFKSPQDQVSKKILLSDWDPSLGVFKPLDESPAIGLSPYQDFFPPDQLSYPRSSPLSTVGAIEARCGDEIIQYHSLGESCDDQSATCNEFCQSLVTQETASCGNGLLEEGESCDGGENCRQDCTFNQVITPKGGCLLDPHPSSHKNFLNYLSLLIPWMGLILLAKRSRLERSLKKS